MSRTQLKMLFTKTKTLPFAAMLTGMMLWGTSCSKNDQLEKAPPIPQPTYSLSQEIIDYDNHLKTNPVNPDGNQTLEQGPIETLIYYAKADGFSAWTTFRIASKFLGAGYGAAISIAGGLGGSVWAYIEKNYVFRPAGSNSPGINQIAIARPTTTSEDFSHEFVGEMHNLYLDSIMVHFNEFSEFESYTTNAVATETYPYVIEKVAEECGLEVASLKENLTFDLYQSIVEAKLGKTPIEDLATQFEWPSYLVDYLNEFITRIDDPENQTKDVILDYCDLFIADIQTQDFTDTEITSILNALSIFKYSFNYWNAKLYQL